MQTKVTKWGNSLGIRIPQLLAEQAEISDGAIVEIEIRNEIIQIRKKKFSLEELLKDISAENMHKETDTGFPVGKEIW
jgi:antitoxin MazE